MAIIWNPARMATGVKEIDDQHQELIRHFNEFHEAMIHRKGQEAAVRMLSFLADYADSHFTREEACMRQYHCPAAAANLAAHNSLRLELAKVKGHIKDNRITIMDLVKVEQMLGAWIQDHICTIDIKLRECVKAQECATN
jgi:hemerythrin